VTRYSKISSLAALASILAVCGPKKTIPTPVLLPLAEGSQIKYVSYVTDRLKQIQHQLEYIPRYYSHSDSLQQPKIHYYIEANKLNQYSVDERGTLISRANVDLSTFALAAGFPYREPISFSYPRKIFEKRNGFGSVWSVKADTQIVVLDSLQKPHQLGFGHRGTACLEGWSEVAVPASPSAKLKVLDVHWTQLQNYLIDSTSGDTLWVQRGEGHEYFEPRFGLARATKNYTVQKKGESPAYRQSTMDLYLMIIPSH
jgi:uncharacterized protein YbdZ (MbtH family)